MNRKIKINDILYYIIIAIFTIFITSIIFLCILNSLSALQLSIIIIATIINCIQNYILTNKL